MLKSLRARVFSLALLVCAGGLGLGGMLLYSALDARDAFHLVRHTQEVIMQLDAVDSNLREAESGVRGYLLTGSVSYLDGFENNIELARRDAARIQGLVADFVTKGNVEGLKPECGPDLARPPFFTSFAGPVP